MPRKQPTGPDLVDQMTDYPSLDEFFDRDLTEKPLSDDDLRREIGVFRRQRAQIDKGE